MILSLIILNLTFKKEMGSNVLLQLQMGALSNYKKILQLY